MRFAFAIAVLAALAAAACSRPIRTARTDPMQPASPREADARQRLADRACSPHLGLLFPGLGQLCTGQPGEGAAFLALGAAELGTGIAVAVSTDEGVDHPGAALPLVGFQDLWLYGYSATLIDDALARHALYAPQDTTADLIAAPFNVQVMKKPEVWLGTLVALGAGVALSLAIDDVDTSRFGADPNVFGREMSPALGYPIAAGVGVGLFTHVAMAEEALFRGHLQSSLARRSGHTEALLWTSGVFGLAHAPNALALPEEDRVEYLAIGLPFITALGGYLGYIYQRNDYSLAAPVAVHFWYDFLLSAVVFALDPQDSPISANLSIPF